MPAAHLLTVGAVWRCLLYHVTYACFYSSLPSSPPSLLPSFTLPLSLTLSLPLPPLRICLVWWCVINSWCKPFWSCAAGDAGCSCCWGCWCCRSAASGLLIIAARFAAGCCQAGAKLLLNCCYSGLLPWSAAKLLLDCCYIPPALLPGWCWPAAGLSRPVLNFCCTASGKRLLDSAKQLLGSKVLPQHMTRYGTRYSTRLQRRWQCTRVWLHVFYISGGAPLLGPPLAQDFVAKLISQRPQDRLSHSVLAAVLSRWRLLAMGLAISKLRTDGFRNLPHWEWSWFKVRLLVQVNLLGQTLWKAVRDVKPHRRWSSI